MQKSLFVQNLVSITALVLTAQSIAAPAFGDTSTAAYKQQMRAYHEKLLAYQVQPGRMLEQRKQFCERLKEFTRADENVDALWAKFDALERRARGTDNKAFADDCLAFAAEVRARTEKHNQGVRADVEKVKESIAAQSDPEAVHQTVVAYNIKTHSPAGGVFYNRRKRIWEELKRCYAQKKNIDNHMQQYLALDKAQSTGNGDLNDLCTKMEDSLALPHNIKD